MMKYYAIREERLRISLNFIKIALYVKLIIKRIYKLH